jgi:O-antigen ligase
MALVALFERTSPKRGLLAFLQAWALLASSAAVHLVFLPCRVPSDAVEELARWAVLLLCAAYAYPALRAETWRRRLSATIVVSALLAALLGLIQYFGLAPALFPSFGEKSQRLYSIFGNQDLFGGYLALAAPLLVIAVLTSSTKRAVAAAFGCMVLVAGLLLSGSRTAWLATAVGALAALTFGAKSWRRPAVLALMTAAALIAAVALAPQSTLQRVLVTFTEQDLGGRARLWFWDGTLRMIAAHPWAGVGPGNFAYWSPHYLGEALHAPGGAEHYHNLVHTLHAHCEPLELVSETGILGAAFGLWLLVRLVRCRGIEWASLSALGVFCLFNPALHSAPHALAGILLAAALLARRERANKDEDFRPSAFPAGAGLAVALALTFFVCYCVVMPSSGLRAAEQQHLSGEPPFDAYEHVLAHPWPNADAREKYGIALFEARRYDAARAQLNLALRGMDTGGVYLLLGMMAAQEGANATARTHLEQCLFRWPSNHLAWKLLLRVSPATEKAAVQARAGKWLEVDELRQIVEVRE